MGLIPYDFYFQDAQGNGKADIAFPQTGALGSPGIDALKTHDLAQTDLTPSWVTLINLGRGYYAALYDPATHGEAFLILDGGGGVAPSNRYQGKALTIDSGLLVAAINDDGTIKALAAAALDASGLPDEPVSWADAQSSLGKMILYVAYWLRHSGNDTLGNLYVKNEAGTVIDNRKITNTGGVLSVGPPT